MRDPRDEPLEVTSPVSFHAWYGRTMPPVEQVREDIWSIPVPFQDNPMRYTFCYALRGDGETVIVDPGWDSAEGFEVLQQGLDVAGLGLDSVTGVLVTHVHPDHHGLTHFVAEARPDAWIGMSADEALALSELRSVEAQSGTRIREQLHAAGVPEDDPLQEMGRHRDPSFLDRMPAPDLVLQDGDAVPLRGRTVRALLTPGHTMGHLCFLDDDDDVILTGDHVLPRISPNVGLHSHSAVSPVRSFLASLDRVGRIEREVLPAHQWRFRNLPERVRELEEHHRERLEEILTILRSEPATAWELAGRLTWAHGWDGLEAMQRWSAIVETEAHLRYLLEDDRIAASEEAPVRYWVIAERTARLAE